jgi:hypothetical protein
LRDPWNSPFKKGIFAFETFHCGLLVRITISAAVQIYRREQKIDAWINNQSLPHSKPSETD